MADRSQEETVAYVTIMLMISARFSMISFKVFSGRAENLLPG
jgi:hypothetical protein